MIEPAAKAVLVVDDDPDTRELLCELLMRRGYPVAWSENGLAAFERIQTSRVLPGVILLDLVMPLMDGHTFLRRAREHPLIKKVPIIFTTADSWAEAPGADAILNKPFKPGMLIATVGRFLKPAENSRV